MRIVIIGGEAAGMSAAAKARRMIKEAEIVVYEASDVISFGACGLPYFVADQFDDPDAMAEFTPEGFAKRGIEVNIRHRVISVNPTEKTLEVENKDGRFTTHYDRLMIATGATEIIPPIAGIEKAGVHGLRVLNDGIALKEALSSPACRRVVVIGSGFIGLEMVEALIHQNKQVRLIEMAPRVIPGAFDKEFSQLIEAQLHQAGVELHLEESVQTILGDEHVSGVVTSKGTYEADLVIVSTGVRPNTAFLQGSGLAQLKNGAIIVDKCGATSLPAIYAAGDCATVHHLLRREPVYLPLATIANKLGRIVGENLAGVASEFPGTLGSACVKVLALEAGRTGLSEDEAKAQEIDYRTVFVSDKNHTNYWPGQSDIHLKLIYEAQTHRILGAQILGESGAVHRLHALTIAITQGVTTEELGLMDFAYAPPFNRTWDILNVAGNVAK